MCWRDGSVIKSAYLVNHLHGIQSLDSKKYICGKIYFKKESAYCSFRGPEFSSHARHHLTFCDFKGKSKPLASVAPHIFRPSHINKNDKSFLKIFCTSSSSWNNLYSSLIAFPEVYILVLVPFTHKNWDSKEPFL